MQSARQHCATTRGCPCGGSDPVMPLKVRPFKNHCICFKVCHWRAVAVVDTDAGRLPKSRAASGRPGWPSKMDHDIVKMAIPSLATVLMDPLLGMVDTAIVGHLGRHVLGGVGLGGMINGAFNWIFGFLSILTVPKISGYMAQGKRKDAETHVGQVLWVAVLVGITTFLLVVMDSGAVVGGEPEMMANAVSYMRARCLANPAVLANFVFIGTLRGLKDARLPLIATGVANMSNLLMDILFVYGFHMGASGAALATALSQWCSCAIMLSALIKRGFVRWRVFAQGPNWKLLQPFLVQGASVSFRTLSVMGVIMTSSTLLAGVGAASQAANEILRQLWIFLVQFIECLNISNQSMTAGALGKGDVPLAIAAVKRHLVYAVALMSAAALIMLTFQRQFIGIFTGDASVIAMATTTLPFLLACFPLDAASSVFDGTLTAVGQATWTAKVTSWFSFLVIGLLWALPNFFDVTLLRLWLCSKLLTILRLPLLVHRVFYSEQSPLAHLAEQRAVKSESILHPVTQPNPSIA